MSDSARDLIVRGIAAAKAKDKAEARHYLNWALRSDPSPDQRVDAWLWLSEVSDDRAEQRGYLEQVLAENMAHPVARRKLAVLDGRLDPADIVDPDSPAPAPAATGPAEARRFVCPTCGGRLTYTPDGASLVCEYCDQRQAVAGPAAAGVFDEQDFVVALATARGHRPPEAARSLQCRSCSAVFMLAPETLSLTCPYCESVYVVETAETRELIPPTAILPFRLAQEPARQAAGRWLAEREASGPAVHGLYLPAWTFDLQLEIRWQRVIRDGYQWRTESGVEPRFYDDVVAAASQALPKPLAEEIHHYRLDGLVTYDPRYLADWPAQVYSVPVAEASLDARSRALDRARAQVRAGLSAGDEELTLSPANLYVTSYKLVLLPVWLARYTQDGQVYVVVVNGQTGAVRGERPPSGARKVWNWLVGED